MFKSTSIPKCDSIQVLQWGRDASTGLSHVLKTNFVLDEIPFSITPATWGSNASTVVELVGFGMPEGEIISNQWGAVSFLSTPGTGGSAIVHLNDNFTTNPYLSGWKIHSNDQHLTNAFNLTADASLPGNPADWVGALIHAVPGPSFTSNTGEVLSANSGSGELSVETKDFRYTLQDGDPYYYVGAFKGLDAPGEWYLDTQVNRLYLWAPEGGDPSGKLLEMKDREKAFDLSGRSFIELNGIDLFAATIITDGNSKSILIDDTDGKYLSHTEFVKGTSLSEGHVSALSPLLETGIVFRGENHTLKNSRLAYSAGSGVSLHGVGHRVINNVIHDMSYAGSDAANIYVGVYDDPLAEGFEIGHNTLYNSGRALIRVDNMSGGRIHHNEMYDAMLQTSDGGAMYLNFADMEGAEIDHNIIHDIHPFSDTGGPTGGTGVGLYFDHGIDGAIVHHNVVYNALQAVMTNVPATNLEFYHNTLYASGQSHGYWPSDNDPTHPNSITDAASSDVQLENLIRRNNIYQQQVEPYVWSDGAGMDAETHVSDGNLYQFEEGANPQLANPAQFNFMPLEGSSAIDAGVSTRYSGSYVGSAPDIGALEFGRTPWEAGYGSPQELLTDDFSGESIGDSIGELNHWSSGGANDSSATVAGNHALSFDRPASGGGPRVYRDFDLTGKSTLTIEAKVTEDNGNNWFGVFVTDDIAGGSARDTYRWQWNAGTNQHLVRLQKGIGGSQQWSGNTDLKGTHDLKFQISHDAGSLDNTLKVWVDGVLEINQVDGNHLWVPSDKTRIEFYAFNQDQTLTTIDDVQITADNSVLLSDNFSQESIGDSLAQLSQWNYLGDVNGGRITGDVGLRFNNPDSGGPRFYNTFDLSAKSTFVVEAEVTEDSGNNWFGIFLTDDLAAGPNKDIYRWQWNASNSQHQFKLQKGNGNPNQVWYGTTSLVGTHQLKLQIDHDRSSGDNAIRIWVDGNLKIDMIDTNKLWAPSSQTRVDFYAFNNDETKTTIDDIRILASESSQVVQFDAFSQESVGDNLSQLENWSNFGTANTSVVNTGGSGRAIRFDEPSSGGPRFFNTYDLSGLETLTVEAKVTEDSGNNWFGIFLTDDTTGGNKKDIYRWQWNAGTNQHLVRLQKGNGASNSNFSGNTSLSGTHDLKLQITHSRSTGNNTIRVWVDGILEINSVDNNGLWVPSSKTRIDFYAFNNDKTITTIDDIQIRGYTASAVGGHVTDSLRFAGDEIKDSNAVNLKESSLHDAVIEAKRRWRQAGADALILNHLQFAITDLGNNLLGQAVGNLITIDRNAAGHGWYVNRNMQTDDEFNRFKSPDGVDLLTVVMHEMGHALGFEHDDPNDNIATLMDDTLGSGERRSPLQGGLGSWETWVLETWHRLV